MAGHRGISRTSPPPLKRTPRKRRRVQVGGRRVQPQRQLSDATVTRLATRTRGRGTLPSVRSLGRPVRRRRRLRVPPRLA